MRLSSSLRLSVTVFCFLQQERFTNFLADLIVILKLRVNQFTLKKVGSDSPLLIKNKKKHEKSFVLCNVWPIVIIIVLNEIIKSEVSIFSS